jgi:hypothetical protein
VRRVTYSRHDHNVRTLGDCQAESSATSGPDFHSGATITSRKTVAEAFLSNWRNQALSREYLLDKSTFRFNRRKASALFLDTLRHMVTSPVLTFEKLTS